MRPLFPDLDPEATAAALVTVAPACVATITTRDDADFLAAVAYGEEFRGEPSPTRQRIADCLWRRSCASRAALAAGAAVAVALILASPANAARHPYAETLAAQQAAPDTEMH